MLGKPIMPLQPLMIDLPERRNLRRCRASRFLCTVLVAVGMLIPMASSSAQPVEPPHVSLDEALDLFTANNPQLFLSKLRVAEVRALARQAAVYPNPSVNLSHEPLWDQGLSHNESYLTLSQKVVWPGLREAQRSAGRSLTAAAVGSHRADSLHLRFAVIETYTKAVAAEARVALLDTVTAFFRQAEQTVQALLAEGEASAYSLRRLRVEQTRYRTLLAQDILEREQARAALGLLILGVDQPSVVVPSDPLMTLPPIPDLPVVLQHSLDRRPERYSATEELQAAAAILDIALRQRRPEPTVSAGVKRQSDGFNGLFLGLTTPLPLFDKNQAMIEARQTQRHVAETNLVLTERYVEHDLRRAHTQYRVLFEHYTSLPSTFRSEADALINTARLSYAEGEMSMIELLDAVAMYLQANSLSLRLQADLQVAYFDLIRAAGGSLPE